MSNPASNRHADLLASLLPPVAYDPTAPNLAAELATEGAILDAAQASAERLICAAPWLFGHPDLLPNWEALYQVTPAPNATTASRQATILARINAQGGLSIAYLINLLTTAGYQAAIDEPREFRAGTSHAGDRLYIDGSVDYYWRVRVRNLNPGQIATLKTWLAALQPAGAHFDIEVI